MMCCVFGCFFFKQKTAYDMRISDWSSDVCSSDLSRRVRAARNLPDCRTCDPDSRLSPGGCKGTILRVRTLSIGWENPMFRGLSLVAFALMLAVPAAATEPAAKMPTPTFEMFRLAPGNTKACLADMARWDKCSVAAGQPPPPLVPPPRGEG